MIWLKLSFLALAISFCDSDSPPESYLVYALETETSVDLYMTNVYLDGNERILSLGKEADLENMVLSRHEDELILYWSYKNSSIARYQLSRKEMDVKTLSDDKAIFLGIGYNEKLYLYSPTSKNINVYDFDSGSKLIELSGLQDTNTDMHCVDVDPLHKDEIYFAECSDDKYTGRVYNISDKTRVTKYEQILPKCFDTWRITRNGIRVFAVAGKEIYLSSYEGAPFEKYHTAKDSILGFAVENSVLFYSTKEKKIFQIFESGEHERNMNVDGLVKKMALYTLPKRYLIYATESDSTINFYKTDFDFNKSINLLNIRKNGKSLDKMFLGYNKGRELFYWTYEKHFVTNIESYDYLTNTYGETQYNGFFYNVVGIGNNDTIYFFSPYFRYLLVSGQTVGMNIILYELIKTKTDFHCVDIDPRNRELIYFAECNKNGNTGKVFDVKARKFLDYNQPLPKCFDKWRITPNGKKVYAVTKNKIYLSPDDGAPFGEFASVGGDIEEFAVGNDALFYTTSQTRKIFKLTIASNEGAYSTSEFSVQDDVKGLLVYQE